MHLVCVCYGQPADPAAFDDYYTRVHIPLALKIPGLVSFTTGKCRSLDGSGPPCYLVARLGFADADSLTTALRSAQMRAAGADVANFATGGVTMHLEEHNVILG
ncbi:EthD family reductase [Mycobacterium botniense]|uniref:Putative ethyl tert-butyl ether degradation protein EthD n=1 Tax=Mycobacterium botniense TaxID=84962 RepID=A0A7I9XV16_9MYCO|nr:EthD family reductase [Mycobacterium botniense]GFG73207.1 putative ethyl tert-butyl ether degradation protein EthD [Mycobacterium botniense]